MKIMHVLAPAHAGGLERVVHALAIGQHARGHSVVAVPLTDVWSDDHSFATPLTRAGVNVRPLILPPRAYLRERAAFAQLLGVERPDVVHSHGYHTDVVIGDVARRAGAAIISTAHGYTRGPWRNRVYEGLDRLALRRFDAVAVVSRPLADELQRSGVRADRIHVVPNAWSRIAPPLDRAAARAALGLDGAAFVIGWVGRMTREKGLDVLVEALPGIADLPLMVFALGDGPERAAQETRAAASGVADRIRWAGMVREAGRFFQAFDMLVLSSRTEGVPMVVLEAMAAGIPLVVTAVGGIPHVVSPHEAVLVPPERPDELAAAIRLVFDQREDAAHRARAARARLDREFSETPWLDRYDEIYVGARRAMEAGGAGGGAR